MRKIRINDWPAFSQFLILEQGIEGKKKALDVYYRRFRKLVAWLGDKEFSRTNFVAFIAEQKAKGLKNSYLNNFLKTARQIDKFLGSEEMKGYKELHEKAHIPKDLLSPDEITKLATISISYSHDREFINQRQKCLIMLLGTTGCRIDEALNLQKEDLHDAPAHVIFRETKNGEDRAVPISDELYEQLRKLSSSKYVFVGSRATVLTQQAMNRDLKERAKQCGIEKRVHAHLFRHSFITEMINQGVDWFALSVIVGHRDPASTRVYYQQSLRDATRIVMQHPLLKSKMPWDTKIALLKDAVNKIFSQEDNVTIQSSNGDFSLRIRK